ncbi:MAG: ribulose-phosphate 3-epimerase [Actinobacteria bacterium]|nr:MAG: ribulose-phosphate 3-epimerase [Actinomycetota bacterium]
MQQPLLIAPSILSADFDRLGDAVALVEAAGADVIHVDVMDGHFVPNLTIGPPVVKALKRVATVPLDVHLMIDNADDTVGWYLSAGADIVVVHIEACNHIHRIVQTIHEAGAQAGVALNPGTPVSALESIIAEVDLVLVMSVNPGFGGQAFIPATVAKIGEVVRLAAAKGASPRIAVDGGIDVRTAPLVTEAGADMLIAGSAVFCAEDPAAALNAIRAAAVTKLV